MIPPERERAPSQGLVCYNTYIVASEVVDIGLGKHGVVLELALAQRRGISRNDDQLCLARSEGLEG